MMRNPCTSSLRLFKKGQDIAYDIKEIINNGLKSVLLSTLSVTRAKTHLQDKPVLYRFWWTLDMLYRVTKNIKFIFSYVLTWRLKIACFSTMHVLPKFSKYFYRISLNVIVISANENLIDSWYNYAEGFWRASSVSKRMIRN